MPASHLTTTPPSNHDTGPGHDGDLGHRGDAGSSGLHEPATHDEWWQVSLRFTDWSAAEQTATTRLAPLLDDVTGPDDAWWFIRKHPDWRVRIRTAFENRGALQDAFDQLAAQGILTRWKTGHYEPETTAFGGPDGITAAHTLFAADSYALLHPAPVPLGRRELSMLLIGALVRGAGLEPYEIGDVWAKVAHDRPLPTDVLPGTIAALTPTVTTLLRTDTSLGGGAFGPTGPLTAAAPHAEAFHACGRTLAALARDGRLNRGLRTIFAYHVIFHWNRAGLDTRQQSLLAHTARAAILGPTPKAAPPRNTPHTITRLTAAAPGETARLDRALRAFPLVPRPRLTCPPLANRLQAVGDHATAADAATDPDKRTDRACAAWNLAALIASDVGFPGLAADLSWQQHRILHPFWPLTGRFAIAALQPLINLARLYGRARQFQQMHRALADLGHALEHGAAFLLHDTILTLDGLTTSDDPYLRAWYREVLAKDGTRALAATGDWTAAAAHAAFYDPDPHRLREAAQTRVIALTLNGDYDSALALLDTTPPRPGEHAVDAALRAHLVARAGDPHHDHLTRLLATLTDNTGQADGTGPAPVLYRVRLTQTANDLGAAPTATGPVWQQLVDEVLQTGDAYAAREALKAPSCQAVVSPDRTAALTDLTHRAALTPHGPTFDLLPELAAFAAPLQLAADALTRTLASRANPCG